MFSNADVHFRAGSVLTVSACVLTDLSSGACSMARSVGWLGWEGSTFSPADLRAQGAGGENEGDERPGPRAATGKHR